MLEVTAAIIVQGDSFLICKRPVGKHHAGLWEFPGGKTEPGESEEACIIREIREELDVNIKVTGKVCDVVSEGRDKTVHLHFFRAEIVSGSIKALEHSELRFIMPEETGKYEFCPADTLMLAKTDMRKVIYAS